MQRRLPYTQVCTYLKIKRPDEVFLAVGEQQHLKLWKRRGSKNDCEQPVGSDTIEMGRNQ